MGLRIIVLSILLLSCAARGQQAGPTATTAGASVADGAHGVLHREMYTTNVVKGLAGERGEFVVYTPAGYSAERKPGYPVLYLLHGWGDTVDGWVKRGHADVALDQMIASGRAQPMVVVMPLGYGDMTFLTNGFEVWRDQDQISNNVNLFGKTLLDEIMPQVEAHYDVAADRDHRAIAGLSMGGLEALTIGLKHPERFAWVGGFSSAIFPVAGQDLLTLDAKVENLRLLWVACGTEDDLLSLNRIFEGHMKQEGLPVTAVETPGRHEWPVWRDNLRHFVPLLFTDRQAAAK